MPKFNNLKLRGFDSILQSTSLQKNEGDQRISVCTVENYTKTMVIKPDSRCQWEFQLGPSVGISFGDQLWVARYTLEVVPNAKKFRYCGIDPELEDKLDQMFLGVIATGDHAWTPNQGMNNENITEDSENIDIGSDSFEDPLENLESISDCGQLKQPIFITSTGRRKKIFGSTFLRSQITQLVNSCTNMTSETNASKTNITSETSSISAAIKVLEQTTEIEAIKKISEYVAQLRRVGKGHGVWHFDQVLLHGEENSAA
ncbi:hypothetical protein M5K25_012302 [Dendrobium thyrsiflorum]|uniref:Uncharacterized protein n=1 Tax=Dendrobium thyrsiflorum TaxID=117978 RepID=A0ABD0UXK1_DENTH